MEKYLSAEERKKEESRRRIEDERLKAQSEDNARQRALMMMMGGKLDDKKESEDKIDLVRPEWMNKPKDEMNDEEKRLVKEFEKKLAVYKEEQEKARKALETELRKLQTVITEICDNFDLQLGELHRIKASAEKIIYQMELRIIKMSQSCIISEDDLSKEQQLQLKLETLKQERTLCTNEIPEIKKELERCREDYESALKRDKELEKQFKKDFHMYEFYFEALTKLFKRRFPDEGDKKEKEDSSLNPFVVTQAENLNDFDPPPLNPKSDMPDGIGIDVWNKLVDLRDKKIASESDVSASSRRFLEMQWLVQNILEESDKIRVEIDRITQSLEEFAEYKFESAYNVESLFELKQGQVRLFDLG